MENGGLLSTPSKRSASEVGTWVGLARVSPVVRSKRRTPCRTMFIVDMIQDPLLASWPAKNMSEVSPPCSSTYSAAWMSMPPEPTHGS